MSGVVPAEPTVRLRGVSKDYGRHHVLRDISLKVGHGEVVGLVGPNGTGKTTLLGIMSGLIRPSDGSGCVLGESIGPNKRPTPFVGIMLEKPAFIEHRSACANLRFLAAIRGRLGDREIEQALADVGLSCRDRRPVRAYSQGMRQRLSLAQAVMERPRLLLLDEPTNGLDPLGVIELRRTVREVAQQGAAVIVSSHLLAEVAALCSRIVIVVDGRVALDRAANESPESLEAAYLAAVGART